MNAIKVQYTVKEEYVETNKENIRRVMDALRRQNNPNIKYSTFLQEDGKTFVHLAFHASKDVAALLPSLPEFQQFREALIASQPELPPQPQPMSLVASAWDIF